MINAAAKVQSKGQTQLATGEHFPREQGKPEKVMPKYKIYVCALACRQ